MTYAEKLQDPRWQQKRITILSRDGWRCRECGGAHNPLEVHHVAYRAEPWETPDELLLTLCGECHDERAAAEAFVRSQVDQFLAICRVERAALFGRNLAGMLSESMQSGRAGRNER